MKLQELSNPNAISTNFVLYDEGSAYGEDYRIYNNTDNDKKLECYVSDSQYAFSYDDKIEKSHSEQKEAIRIFKTVLYDFKKYVIDKNVKTIYFSGSTLEPSRIKLYNTLTTLLAKCGYLRILDKSQIRYYFSKHEAYGYEIIMDMASSSANVLFLFVKKNSNIIPLDEVRNPSKPSDKFKLAHTSDFGYSKSYTYYSIHDINSEGDKDILDIGFHSGVPSEVTMTFELNGTDEQSPEYAHLAMSVFQTVMYHLNNYIKDYKPKILKFSADTSEPSRVSLYKRICKNIQGYSVKEDSGMFELTRTK